MPRYIIHANQSVTVESPKHLWRDALRKRLNIEILP